MFDLAVLPLFLTACFFLVISPGPDMVMISAYASTRGFIAGLYLAIGIFLSGIIQTLAVAFGLGTLMQQVPVVAVAVKSIGALYLAWLGYKMLKSWWQRQTLESSGQTARNE
ncbi:MAG: LysE family translocator, partial [Cohaesibacteraceae bacterium]|nr:LysE family translocator [Cohaesibacteraceae bacterium]